MGIGKTRLVNELLARIETRSRRVIRTDCTLATRDLSYGAVADLVRDTCGIGEDDRPESVKTKLRVTLARLRSQSGSQEAEGRAEQERMMSAFCLLLGLPLPEATVTPQDGTARRDLIRQGVLHLVEALSSAEPLIIAIENVHFADTPSLELLEWLVAQPLERPVFLFAIGRPEDRLGTKLSGFERIVLHQLGDEDRYKLVLERLGESEEARELAKQICTRTGGNPFFISEVIEALIDRGVVRFEGKERKLRVEKRGTIRIPTTLEGVIASRIDELPPEERLLLRWASVAGLNFSASMLGELAGGDVTAPLGRLVKRRILMERESSGTQSEDTDEKTGRTTDPGRRRYGFRYPVMREVAYDGPDPHAPQNGEHAHGSRR